jgi:hypothetical protein
LPQTLKPAKAIKPITHANGSAPLRGPGNGFDGADSFGRDGADRSARALSSFMEECRVWLTMLNETDLVKAQEFVLSDEWKTVEEASGHSPEKEQAA